MFFSDYHRKIFQKQIIRSQSRTTKVVSLFISECAGPKQFYISGTKFLPKQLRHEERKNSKSWHKTRVLLLKLPIQPLDHGCSGFLCFYHEILSDNPQVNQLQIFPAKMTSSLKLKFLLTVLVFFYSTTSNHNLKVNLLVCSLV